MSTMNAELRAALRDAGASAEKADAAAIVTPSAEQVATKTDFAVVLAELRFLRRCLGIMVVGMAVAIGMVIQLQIAVSENTAAIHQLQVAVSKNTEAIEQNRLALAENRRAIEENRQALAENARQLENIRVLVEDIRNRR